MPLDRAFTESQFTIVSRGIRSILSREPVVALANTYEEMLLATTVLCTRNVNKAADLHDALNMALERCVVSIAADLRNKEEDGLPALSSIVEAWSWFNQKVHLLRTILTELDRGYLMEKHLPGVRELGYSL